jgi:hypothetical protein
VLASTFQSFFINLLKVFNEFIKFMDQFIMELVHNLAVDLISMVNKVVLVDNLSLRRNLLVVH